MYSHHKIILPALLTLGITVASTTAGAASPEGFTEPYRVVEVASPESGVVADLKIREGDQVAKGQIVAVLDNRMLNASLAVAKARMEATADIEAAQARYEQLTQRRQRINELAARGSARPDEVSKAKADAAIAVAELKGARERQEVAELEYERLTQQIDRRTIKSPISGVVVKIGRERGELVSGSDAVIAHVAELGRLNVVSHVSEKIARSLTQGEPMKVRLSEGREVTGTVDFVSPTVDPRSGTLQVKVLLKNGDGAIRSGTRATLAIVDSGLDRGLSAIGSSIPLPEPN